MDHAKRLALVSLGLAACISTPADDESLLTFHGALQGADGASEAAFAFTTDIGNALHLVEGTTQGSFPGSVSFELSEPPPADTLYALRSDEPKLAFAYITAVRADHPASLRIANSKSGFGGCGGGACTESETWCSEGANPAQDVCYTETTTCDLNRQNCKLTTDGDASLKGAPWTELAGVSANYAVLYLSAPARAGSLTALAFANGAALGAGYHLLAARPRSEAEQDQVGACYERSEQLALARYNAQHGTTFADPIDIPDADYEALFFAAQRELECPQTEKLYTPIADPSQRALSIQLTRDDDAALDLRLNTGCSCSHA